MSEELDGIHTKLDKMTEIMTVIQVSQAKTEVSIVEHIRRTNIAEENIKINAEDIAMVKEHVSQVRAVIKFCLWIGSGALAIATALLTYFRK
jgi:hypothetical protein